MRTDDLIEALAADNPPQRASVGRGLMLAAFGGGIIAAAGMQVAMGVRPDIAAALETWRFDVKLAIVWLAVAMSLLVVWRLASPLSRLASAKPILLVPAAMVLAVAVELSSVPASAWGTRLVGSNALICLTAIPVLALAPLAATLYALRAGAPASPGTAGAFAGLFASMMAAAFYGLHCADDSPLFVATWYLLASLIVATLGAVLGRRFLKW
ncbi:MAG: DUF1109 family protein [Hyphomicrobiaceae bacterium]|nr:DUF1109 family protein [Hyphomicrobiaceae bacterium]